MRKIHTFLIFLFFLISTPAHADSYTISGQYLDKANKPISGAVVVLLIDNTEISRDTTVSDGSFSLEVTGTGIPEIPDNSIQKQQFL